MRESVSYSPSLRRNPANTFASTMGSRARGLTQNDLMDGATRSTMDELAAQTMAADKVLVF